MARDTKTYADPYYEPPVRRKSTATATTGATAVTTPAPTAPKKGFMAGHTGPKPGTPEFKAARKAGQTPIRDYVKVQMAARKTARAAKKAARPARPARPAYNTGIVPPHMNPSPVPRPRVPHPAGPRPASDGPRPPPILKAASALASKKKPMLTKR